MKMKKLYSNPEAELFMLLSSEDILTESENEDIVEDPYDDKDDVDRDPYGPEQG
jgi:hypothetical protein